MELHYNVRSLEQVLHGCLDALYHQLLCSVDLPRYAALLPEIDAAPETLQRALWFWGHVTEY